MDLRPSGASSLRNPRNDASSRLVLPPVLCLARGNRDEDPRSRSCDEQPAHQGIGLAAAALSRDGGALVYPAMDVRLLAGMDVSRGLFRGIALDPALSDEKGSAASGATDERGPCGRERARSKDHHVAGVAGIYRTAGYPGAGSSLRVVSDAARCCTRRRRPRRARLPRYIFRLQGKYLHLRDHRIGRGPEGHLDRAVRSGAPSDVRGGPCPAWRHPDCAWLLVGRARLRGHSAGVAMETV